jgi:hypothetical protein
MNTDWQAGPASLRRMLPSFLVLSQRSTALGTQYRLGDIITGRSVYEGSGDVLEVAARHVAASRGGTLKRAKNDGDGSVARVVERRCAVPNHYTGEEHDELLLLDDDGLFVDRADKWTVCAE